ncbi:MAG: hypothetical protein JST09_01375, partial [Bacteroidetes bacterium]|nr:hypothetical protein [Bacteroidota bacterium]
MKRLYTLFFLFFSGVQLLAQVKEDSLALRVSDTTQKKTIVHKEETKSSVVLDTIVT